MLFLKTKVTPASFYSMRALLNCHDLSKVIKGGLSDELAPSALMGSTHDIPFVICSLG